MDASFAAVWETDLKLLVISSIDTASFSVLIAEDIAVDDVRDADDTAVLAASSLLSVVDICEL